MRNRFDENLIRSFGAVALLFALFCRSGQSYAQVAESLSNGTPFSLTDTVPLSDTTQSVSSPLLDSTNSDPRLAIQQRNGAIYLGTVDRDHKPEGQGSYTEPTGTILEGEWHKGNPYKLSGTVVYPDGTREVGKWNYDTSNGDGKITWSDGRIYKGPWKFLEGFPDLPDGQGEMTWPDGRKYVGQFRDGKMNGAGKMTYPNAKVEDGSWQEDRFLGSTH